MNHQSVKVPNDKVEEFRTNVQELCPTVKVVTMVVRDFWTVLNVWSDDTSEFDRALSLVE